MVDETGGLFTNSKLFQEGAPSIPKFPRDSYINDDDDDDGDYRHLRQQQQMTFSGREKKRMEKEKQCRHCGRLVHELYFHAGCTYECVLAFYSRICKELYNFVFIQIGKLPNYRIGADLPLRALNRESHEPIELYWERMQATLYTLTDSRRETMVDIFHKNNINIIIEDDHKSQKLSIQSSSSYPTPPSSSSSSSFSCSPSSSSGSLFYQQKRKKSASSSIDDHF